MDTVRFLSRLDKCVVTPRSLASARDMYYCAYSMKTSNNFQNVQPTSFEVLHIINSENISINEQKLFFTPFSIK